MCLSYYSLAINPRICFHGEIRKKDVVDTPSFLGLYMHSSIMPKTCLTHFTWVHPFLLLFLFCMAFCLAMSWLCLAKFLYALLITEDYHDIWDFFLFNP